MNKFANVVKTVLKVFLGFGVGKIVGNLIGKSLDGTPFGRIARIGIMVATWATATFVTNKLSKTVDETVDSYIEIGNDVKVRYETKK